VCDSSSISVLLINFEDMQARENSNNRFEKPINALVAKSRVNQIKFNNSNSNKRSREHQDDDFTTYLPKLPDQLPVKGDKGDLVGPYSKFDKSESRFN